ncbi:MAG: hypothetical protein ACRDTR_13525 [Rubrobacter sp.]
MGVAWGRMLARVAALLVLIAFVAGICVNAWLERRLGLQGYNTVEDGVLFLGFGMFAVVGALLVAKRPSNTIGWILSAASLVVGVSALETYAAYVMTTRGRPDALAVFGAWANAWYWLLFLPLVFVYLPLLFPDGRLPSRRWLPVAVLPGIGAVSMIVLAALVETLKGQNVDYRIDNPIGIEGLAHVEELPVIVVLGGLFAVGAVGAVASLVVRFRRSRGAERQQLKWFLYAAAPVPIIPVSDYAPVVIDDLVFAWVLIGLPAAIGIAVLRYRLYDIDLVINRTLVYGSLTAMLALVYLGSVVGLQRLLTPVVGEGNQLAVVASTLLIAALFGPLRRKVQDFIDRRFYRKKYDARETLETFGARLRNETDLDELNGNLVSVVRETLQPEHVSVWLRQPEEAEDHSRFIGPSTKGF